jgi:hypothetical protein
LELQEGNFWQLEKLEASMDDWHKNCLSLSIDALVGNHQGHTSLTSLEPEARCHAIKPTVYAG